MKRTITTAAALLIFLPGMALGQQMSGDQPQPTGKCWKVNMRTEADFYAKGWAKRNGFVGVVLLNDSMRYIEEGRIKEISQVHCTSAGVKD